MLLSQGKRQEELLQSCLNQLQDLQAFVMTREPHPQDVLQLQVRSCWCYMHSAADLMPHSSFAVSCASGVNAWPEA